MDFTDLKDMSKCGEHNSTDKFHQSNVKSSTQYANSTSYANNTSKSTNECLEYEVLQKTTQIQSTVTTEEGIWGRIKKKLIVIILVIQVMLIVAVVTIAVLFSASKATRQDSPDCNLLKRLDELIEKMIQMDIKIERLQKQFEQNIKTGASNWRMVITDLDQEGTWKYYGTNTAMSFVDWRPGQPNNFGGNENCGFFWNRDEYDYKWNDYYCTLTFYTICEKEIQ